MYRKRLLLIGLIIINMLVFNGCNALNTSIIRKNKFEVAYLNEGEILDEKVLGELENNSTINLSVIEENYEDEESFKKDFVKIVKNNDLIIVSGKKFENIINETATNYRNKKFIVISDKIKESNVQNISFRYEEGGFLAGLLAGSFTKNDIGFIGYAEKEDERNQKLIYGFISGVKIENINTSNKLLENKNISVLNEDSNEEKAYEDAINFYENGCDVILVDGKKAIEGVLKAAKEKNKYIINIGYEKIDDNVLGSVLIKVDDVLESSINDLNEGKFESGSRNIIDEGVKDGIIDLYINNNLLEENKLSKIEYYKNELIKEKIEIPTMKEEIYEYNPK